MDAISANKCNERQQMNEMRLNFDTAATCGICHSFFYGSVKNVAKLFKDHSCKQMITSTVPTVSFMDSVDGPRIRTPFIPTA